MLSEDEKKQQIGQIILDLKKYREVRALLGYRIDRARYAYREAAKLLEKETYGSLVEAGKEILIFPENALAKPVDLMNGSQLSIIILEFNEINKRIDESAEWLLRMGIQINSLA